MGQRINAKGFRLALKQQWSIKASATILGTKRIMDLRFQALITNQILKKKN